MIEEFIWDYEGFLRQHEDWDNSSYLYFDHFSTSFLRENKDKLNWAKLSESQQTLTIAQMEQFKDYLDWDSISRTQKLTTEFVQKYNERVNWRYIMANQINIPIEVIRKYYGKNN